MKRIFSKRILGCFPTNVTIDRNTISNSKQEVALRDEFWDKYSILNPNDLSVKCLLEHDPKQVIASIRKGTLRIWITNKGMHVEILPEANNVVNENVFFRMQSDQHFGLSPGYHSSLSERVMADGSLQKRVELTEISLTKSPANIGSMAVLEIDMNDKLLEERMTELKKWATHTSDNWHKLVDAEVTKARAYLNEQSNMLKAVSGAQPGEWSREKINVFKRNHPRFQEAERRGYERATLR